MNEYQPVATLADLATLDADEVQEGYFVGLWNKPLVMATTSRSFWHGYRTGQFEAGLADLDEAQIAILVELAILRTQVH